MFEGSDVLIENYYHNLKKVKFNLITAPINLITHIQASLEMEV